MYLRLHLRFFAWITSIAYRVAVSIISPCRNHGRPIMKYTHVSNVSVGYVPTEYTLWWTWRESNPRPECLHFEGITTILLFNQLTLVEYYLPVRLFGP